VSSDIVPTSAFQNFVLVAGLCNAGRSTSALSRAVTLKAEVCAGHVAHYLYSVTGILTIWIIAVVADPMMGLRMRL